MFSENDVVCFLGDSIIDTALWIRRIYDYYRNILGIKCEMYNCGVSGDTAGHALHRLEKTVFIYKPTVVVIEFGINDIRHDLYGDLVTEEETIIQRHLAMDTCISDIPKLADTFSERGIRIIFCTPTRYNDLLECEVPVKFGLAGALEEISGRIRKLSIEYKAELIDFNESLRTFMNEFYQKGDSLTLNDRIHPHEAGAELLAQIFLKEQGFDIEAAKDMRTLTALTEKPYDTWENKRYELELKARAGHFVRWCCFYGETNEEIILHKVGENLKNLTHKSDNPWIINQFQQYLKYHKDIPQYQNELISHTKSIHRP